MSALLLAACAALGVSQAAANTPSGTENDLSVVRAVSGGAFFSPRSSSRLGSGLTRKLSTGFQVALEHLEEHPGCRSLFHGLSHEARESLSRVVYVPASGRQEQRFCSRGVSAFTEVGSSVTYVCRGFSRLAPAKAAMTLIHEALHHAGLPENPNHADMLNSAEINSLVSQSCSL